MIEWTTYETAWTGVERTWQPVTGIQALLGSVTLEPILSGEVQIESSLFAKAAMHPSLSGLPNIQTKLIANPTITSLIKGLPSIKPN